MSVRKTLFLCCSLLATVACQDAGLDPSYCENNTRCDDPSQAISQLMPRAPATPGSVGITRNQDQWLFEVIGSKGEIVLMSQSYAARNSAQNGILSVFENGVQAEQYALTQTSGGYGFVLRAANNEVIADSQTFATESEAITAAAAARDLVAEIVQYRAALDAGAQFRLDRDGSSWEFGLRDDEGDSLLASQKYSRRATALNGIDSVRNNGKDATRYQLLDGPPRFILKASNGQEIAESSKSYPTLDAAQAAVNTTQALLQSERVANPW